MVKGYSRCIKCGRVIAIVEQVETENGYTYVKHNEECRYIDKWGFDRNFCKECMEKGR